MTMPGFTAGVSLSPPVRHHRARFDPLAPNNAVVAQRDDDEVLYEADFYEDGKRTHVTVTRFTPFDPDSVPEFFEGFGPSWKASGADPGALIGEKREIREGGGSRTAATRQQCIQECSRVYDAKKLACAADSNPSACRTNAYWDYWDCYGLCTPI
jgi:hypothetical protein